MNLPKEKILLIDEEQAKKMRLTSSDETASFTQGVVLVKASELKPQPIDWIWNGWLASGKFHLIGGIAGTGKTSIALALASTITRGGLFPNGATSESGEVVMWTGEDDPADTLTPRLMAMGADLEKVHFVCGFNSFGKERPFNPATDLDELKVTLEGLPNLRLLILDPIVAVVTKDGNKNSDVRNDLAPLVEMSHKLNFAILGITHFSKGTSGMEPIERITGSLAFGAVARLVLVASKVKASEGSEKRIFLRAKSNIGADDGGFEYELEKCLTHNQIETTKVLWGKYIEGSATDLLTDTDSSAQDDGINGCVHYLGNLLTEGAVSVKEILSTCKDAGFSESTVKRSKTKMNLLVCKTGFGKEGKWTWELAKGVNTSLRGSPNYVNSLVKNDLLSNNSPWVEGEI
jgi:putative DNA primase/helicase